MTVILTARFGYPVGALPSQYADKWEQGLAGNAAFINNQRILSIPDANAFSTKIATPSSARYAAQVTVVTNPRKAKLPQDVIDNQLANLAISANKYATKLDKAFETVGLVVAKKFVDAVAASKGLFQDGASARTMRATGVKLGSTGIGAAVLAPMWLTAHPNAIASVRQGIDEVVSGSPFDIVAAGYEDMFMRLLTAEITFAMIQAEKSLLNSTRLASLNARLNNICQSHLDPGKGLDPFSTGGLTHCNVIDHPGVGEMLEVQLNQV